jgi:hypothetical protein
MSTENFRKESLFEPTLSGETRLAATANSANTGGGVSGHDGGIHESRQIGRLGGRYLDRSK